MKNPERLQGKRGAALLRVSSTKQDNERQAEALKAFVAQHGLSIGADDWYEDVRSRMDSHKAKEFHVLLGRVDEGRYDYVLILSQNRFGVLHDFEFSSFCNRLLEAGVELWDTVTGLLNDPGDIATRVCTVVANAASDRELTEKAYHSITGKVHRIQTGTTYFGGLLPYGAAVAVFGSDERLKFRVEVLESRRVPSDDGKGIELLTRYQKVYPDGTTEEKEGGFPAYEDTDRVRYCWSQIPGRVEMVRQMFAWYASESWTFSGLAAKLMALGVRNYYGDTWQGVQVKNLLRNPIYIGIPTWNKGGGRAKKWEFIGGKYQPVPLHKNRPQPTKTKTAEDWLPVPERYRPEPLIDADTWRTVQDKVLASGGSAAPRKGKHWLSGLVVCGGCGKKMYGAAEDKKHRKQACFLCSTYKAYFGADNPTMCGKNVAKVAALERLVGEYLGECEADLDTMIKGKDNPELLRPLNERLTASQDDYLSAWERLRAFNVDHLPEGKTTFHKFIAAGRFNIDTGTATATKDGDGYRVDGATDIDLYNWLYATSHTKLLTERAELERQREDLYERMKGYKSDFARKRADQEMDELSSRIDAYNAQLERLDSQIDDSTNALAEAATAVREAREAFAGDSGRRKAEAVRKVIRRIVCHFGKCPDANGSQASTQLERVEIFPAEGDTSLRHIQYVLCSE